jgi:TfoX/Sxy family transcriptional regulator of competence genes
MASDKTFIEFIVDQMAGTGTISYRKMFGEYAIYCDGKVVALVCDNQLFVKPTESGRAYIGKVFEAPPYPGAKLYFLIDELVPYPSGTSIKNKMFTRLSP